MNLANIITALISGVCTGGVYGLFASSYSFQLGALNIADFSFGSWLMMSMYMTFYMLGQWGWGIVPFLIILLAAYFLIGFFLCKFILSKRNMENNMVITMGISMLLQNAAIMLFTSYPRSMGIIEEIFKIGEVRIAKIRLALLVLSAIILLGFQMLLNRTWIGKTIRAVVQNRDVACLMGVNANRVKNVAYAISYIMLAASGIMLVVLFSVEPTTGEYYQMMSFLICIIGGLGNIKGAFFSGLLIGVLMSVLNLISAQFAIVILFALFVIFLVVKPTGLFTKTSR